MAAESPAVAAEAPGARITLMRVLSPLHIWGLGVGIVLVGEFMGWNFTIAKGGVFGSLVACWFAGILYSCVAMIDSEVSSTVASAGGQYAQGKHIIGPLAAFVLGLCLIFEYTMLEAGDAIVNGALMNSLNSSLSPTPWVILTIAILTYLNYRGVYIALTVNYIITAIAFVTILLLLFGQWGGFHTTALFETPLGGKNPENPYGWLGFLAALQFGIWYYLGIEGTAQTAEECRSAPRALPIGTMSGLITLLIAATITWYVATGLVDWITLGSSAFPLYDAALATGKAWLEVALWIGTLLSCLASANGCISDASRAWFAMGRDQFIPRFFGGVHPRYKSPYKGDPLPGADRHRVRLHRAPRSGDHLLDHLGAADVRHPAHQHDSLSAALSDGLHQARLRLPVAPLPVVRPRWVLCTDVRRHLLWVLEEPRRRDGVLHRRFAVVLVPPLQDGGPLQALYDAVAAA